MDNQTMPTLVLMKPNREPIGELTQAYNITQESSLGEIPLLTFSLPMKVLIRHQLTDNENVIKLKEKMIVYYEYKNIKEYFVVQKITKSHDEDKDELKIECSGLGKQLAYRTLTDVRFTSKNARQLLSSVLQGTTWTIGVIAGKYEISYRSIDFSGSVLQFIYEVAEAFEGLAILNSVTRTVNLYDPKEYGMLIGSPIGYGRLVQNIIYESDSELQATRLNTTGKEGITIASVTSTGMPYLEDFSYYYDLMSDSLKNALINYKILLDSKEGLYGTYLSELEALRSQLVTKQGELVDLNRELEIIQNTLDVQNSQNQDNTQTLIDQAAKKNQINNKTNEINLLLSQIVSKQTEINNLSVSLSISTHLNPSQIEELQGNFIIEADYSNEYISDPKQLKELATQYFLTIREPKIIVDIDVVNLDAIIDRPRINNLKSEDLFVLGNYIGIEYELSKINVTAQIIGKSYDFENDTINLTISNITKAKTYGEIQAERIEQSISQSNSFAAGKWAYDNNIARTDEVTQILNSTWSAVEREIEAGVNNSVTINNRGIWITDSSDPNNLLVLQNGVMGISRDRGNTFKTALTPNGCIKNKLCVRMLKLKN